MARNVYVCLYDRKFALSRSVILFFENGDRYFHWSNLGMKFSITAKRLPMQQLRKSELDGPGRK